MSEETQRAEPSFGTVRFSRQSHGGEGANLFGSDIQHGTTVSLAIYHGVECRSPYNTRYTADGTQPIVEVILSPLQFSELLTTMNVGFGVPCTIRSTETLGHIKHAPPAQSERELLDRELNKSAMKVGSLLDSSLEVLSDKALTQGKRQTAIEAIRKAKQEIESSMPYMIKKYQDRLDKVTNDCKAEVEAYVVSHVIDAGLSALQAPTPTTGSKFMLEDKAHEL